LTFLRRIDKAAENTINKTYPTEAMIIAANKVEKTVDQSVTVSELKSMQLALVYPVYV